MQTNVWIFHVFILLVIFVIVRHLWDICEIIPRSLARSYRCDTGLLTLHLYTRRCIDVPQVLVHSTLDLVEIFRRIHVLHIARPDIKLVVGSVVLVILIDGYL